MAEPGRLLVLRRFLKELSAEWALAYGGTGAAVVNGVSGLIRRDTLTWIASFALAGVCILLAAFRVYEREHNLRKSEEAKIVVPVGTFSPARPGRSRRVALVITATVVLLIVAIDFRDTLLRLSGIPVSTTPTPLPTGMILARMSPLIVAGPPIPFWTSYRTANGAFIAPADVAVWLTITNNSDKAARITGFTVKRDGTPLVSIDTNPERHIYYGVSPKALNPIPEKKDLRYLASTPIAPQHWIKGMLLFNYANENHTLNPFTIEVEFDNGTSLVEEAHNDSSRSSTVRYEIVEGGPTSNLSALPILRDVPGNGPRLYSYPPP